MPCNSCGRQKNHLQLIVPISHSAAFAIHLSIKLHRLTCNNSCVDSQVHSQCLRDALHSPMGIPFSRRRELQGVYGGFAQSFPRTGILDLYVTLLIRPSGDRMVFNKNLKHIVGRYAPKSCQGHATDTQCCRDFFITDAR